MPPKGSKKAAKAGKTNDTRSASPTAVEEDKSEDKHTTDKTGDEHEEPAPASDTNGTSKGPSKKRKAESTPNEPSKASRRSDRGAAKSSATPLQMLNFLLSDTALDLCRPEDEMSDLQSRGKDTRTYAGSQLSPFEELLCAIVLSRPISHRLGLRTIRTILNEPYAFTDPKSIIAAGPEKRHQAMFDARTQHKDKTAQQIGLVAQVVADKFGTGEEDTSLEKVREKAGRGWDEERNLLQKEIKGLGKTGLDIFFRRVQWLWPEAYPFVDERTARGVEKLGLPKSAEGLRECIEKEWKGIEKKGLPKHSEAAKRRVFVVICERATSADLEGKAEELVEAASKS
ncbi:hypothetical protein CAC42_2351 [Sphaceloma murrayae]|uniref:Uncharacterized protein n=1 Tax=Sphaceloma murrayae TaxID=2082308 RepID=A0A2K1QJQ2_9PEZI|nr:hypothetical protein CAC42_2351 [Sphaceloma murrayae]